MRLTGIFVLLAVLVGGMAVVVCDPWDRGWFQQGPASIYAVEGTVALILILLSVLYYKTVRPLHAISNGIDLLRAQDFSSRLSRVNSYEADQIVEMFNSMMNQLKNERLHMREQNHFFDLIISVSPMGIVILDTYGRITSANPSALAFLRLRRCAQGCRQAS